MVPPPKKDVDGVHPQPAKRKISISEAFNSFQNGNAMSSPNTFEYSGRSYISMGGHRPSVVAQSPVINSGLEIHEQSANLASIGVTEDEDSITNNYDIDTEFPESEVDSPLESGYDTPLPSQSIPSAQATESSPLIKRTELDLENFPSATTPSDQPQPSWLHTAFVKPIMYTPAVFLGTLLNILDGLSYGMIMFPVSEQIFSSLAPTGLSMFYMSTIVSQLVYSLGGSAFKSGIGSEMIEVTPFFHTMALSIASQMAGESQEAIIATTITTYAASSIVTGLVFYILGKCRLGLLVGFFPRHILVGCIGGVGYFLIATGIEVSSRLEGGLEYNAPTFQYLFSSSNVILEWTVPLALAVVLIVLQHKVHNTLLVPLYFITVFALFHLIVSLVPAWSLESARASGWVFPAVEDNEPWYSFYFLYKFQLVDWFAILRQIPSMLALTFFGILHVPINVPALAVSVGMDQFDVDRELVAHGYSNAISGLLGSIQNYLVYTNSVLFVRAGADDRLAGVLLAIATGAVMVAGPVVIGYIPVCVVGALIYLLGYELLKEALYDTYGRLRRIEYTTVIIIVVTMGAVDFVVGILVGILLACLSFVVEAARSPVVKGIYSGSVARSTVLRHPKQQEFLRNVGNQICIVKLQGTLFFGSIGGVEKVIRDKFEDDIFKKDPIKYLIIDMNGVSSIDFSAAEGFRRILNLTNEFNTQLIFTSVMEEDEIIKALRDAGLWDQCEDGHCIQLFSMLNYGLEWCENNFLQTYKSIQQSQLHKKKINVPGIGRGSSGGTPAGSHSLLAPGSTGGSSRPLMASQYDYGATPRTTHVYQAATKTVYDEQKLLNKYYSLVDSSFKKQPLPLIMITFQGLLDKDEEFWSDLTEFFKKEQIPAEYEFYNTSKDNPAFFIVASGLIRSVFEFESDNRTLTLSILPNTAFGDLYEVGTSFRQVSYTTVADSVVWKLSDTLIAELLKLPNGPQIYNELFKIQTKLIRERSDTMTANLVIAG